MHNNPTVSRASPWIGGISPIASYWFTSSGRDGMVNSHGRAPAPSGTDRHHACRCTPIRCSKTRTLCTPLRLPRGILRLCVWAPDADDLQRNVTSGCCGGSFLSVLLDDAQHAQQRAARHTGRCLQDSERVIELRHTPTAHYVARWEWRTFSSASMVPSSSSVRTSAEGYGVPEDCAASARCTARRLGQGAAGGRFDGFALVRGAVD